VLNLAYGVQGRLRYVHVPGLLEMLGIPYVGSGPLAHALCSDKITSKILMRHHGVPTPEFEILRRADFAAPRLSFPMVVKPRAETTSLGVHVVEDERTLREVVSDDLERFGRPVLVEDYIAGRELHVSLLGDGDLRVLPPTEIEIGGEPPEMVGNEQKVEAGERDEVRIICPADLTDDAARRAADLARKAYRIMGCNDWARVDFRMDGEGDLYVLEINSLPHLSRSGSYLEAAREAGISITELLARVVDRAAARWEAQGS
jgi:D-alanine-D-alanine ligase